MPKEWAKHNFWVPNGTQQGLYDPDFAPYLNEIMDCYADDDYDDVIFQASAQVGKTFVGSVCASWTIAEQAEPLGYYNVTDDMAIEFAEMKIKSAFLSSPILKALWPNSQSKKDLQRDKGGIKRFQNGVTCYFLGSKSKSNFRDKTFRYGIFDEVTAWDGDVGGDGDPLSLGRDRTKTYRTLRKHFLMSTPGLYGQCRVNESFLSGDQRYWHVPCPDCGTFHKLEWENIRWNQKTNDPATAHHVCPHCGYRLYESERLNVVRHGHWVASAVAPGRASFQISELASVLSTMAAVVKDYLERSRSPEGRRAFDNTNLGRVHRPDNTHVKEELLKDRMEQYDWRSVPNNVGLITEAVDTQDAYLAYKRVGWGLREESWVLRYEIIEGDPRYPEVWQRLDQIRREPVIREDGHPLYSSICFVDLGGHRTEHATQYVRARANEYVFGIYGARSKTAQYVQEGRFANKYEYKGLQVGQHRIKDDLFSRLTIVQPGDKCVHFPLLPDTYFLELTAERKDRKGSYVSHRKRNEALDLMVYNIASYYFLMFRVDLERLIAGVIETCAKKTA